MIARPAARPVSSAPGPPSSRPFTVAELAERFGSLPAFRIHQYPAPGTATREDAERLRGGGFSCELVDGTLIERAMSQFTSVIAVRIAFFLQRYFEERGGGFVDLYGGTLQRAPDAAAVLDEQQPGGPVDSGYAEGAPALCVEVFSRSNTRPEMERKRREYFENGCRLCWTVFPPTDRRPATVEVHTPGDGPGDDDGTVLTLTDTLVGDPVLPGFAVPVARLFSRAD